MSRTKCAQIQSEKWMAKSAEEFQSNLFETLSEVQDGEPQIVTLTTGDGVVLIAHSKLNAALEENAALRKAAGVGPNQSFENLKKGLEAAKPMV